MTVLFASDRPLGRCENITSVFDAYKGEKDFACGVRPACEKIRRGGYDLLVTDEFPMESKAPVMMIFHGMSGGKTYGLDQPHPYFSRSEAKLLEYVVCSSDELTEQMAALCGVPEEKVYPLGMPRTDDYFTIHEKIPWYIGKRVYLYAPTFRNMHESPAPSLDLEMIDDLLMDDEVFIIKYHMITGKVNMEKYKHIVQADPMVATTPYLMSCDVLITDYSSIMMDAHVAEKPVVLFAKDHKRFMSERGMMLDYPDGYASRFVRNEKELVRQMRLADMSGPLQEDEECRRITGNMCDGHATKRVVELIGRAVG